MKKTVIDIVDAFPRSPEFQFDQPVNWTLKKNEHWVFLGPNGSGKTVLSRIIRNEIPLKNGTIDYTFENDKSISQNIRLVSFRDIYNLADFHSYYYQQRWNSTAEETPLIRDIINKEYPVEDIQKIGSLFQIENILDKRLILLSSGELRKFLIIRMLLSKPELLIIDNPFIGLDEESRKVLNHLLEKLSTSGYIQIILLLADSADIPSWCNLILPMKQNGIMETPVTISEYKKNTVLEKDLFRKKVCNINSLIHNPFQKRSLIPYNNVVSMQNVQIKYGKRIILRNLDWIIKKGEKWALLGPNGAGKSTLLSLIYADNPQAYANNFYLFDKKRGSGESIWEIKERIGFLSPEFHLYYKGIQSCREIIASGYQDYTGLYKKGNTQQLELALKWLELIGADHLKDKLFSQISFGEQRLVILLRAFVKNPDLLILDEPLHGLDKENKKLALSLIEQFCQQEDKTLIYVTHYLNEIPEIINQHKLLIKTSK